MNDCHTAERTPHVKRCNSCTRVGIAHSGCTVRALLSSRSATIAGGTTEVRKNIIGERNLGLPREPGR